MGFLASFVRASSVIMLGFVIGAFGIGLAQRFAPAGALNVSEAPGAAIRFTDVNYNLKDNGRRVGSIDLTIATKLAQGRAIRYRLRPDGLWSAECLLETTGPLSSVTRCVAPKGSTSEGTTELSVVLMR
jgi:hypothetical protein